MKRFKCNSVKLVDRPIIKNSQLEAMLISERKPIQ